MRTRIGRAGNLADTGSGEDVRSCIPAAKPLNLDTVGDPPALTVLDETQRATTRELGRVGRKEFLRAVETHERRVPCRDLLDLTTLTRCLFRVQVLRRRRDAFPRAENIWRR